MPASPAADLPALVVACGTAVSAVIGAVLMRRAGKASRVAEPDVTDGDPENRPARLRERISRLEARVDSLEQDGAERRAAEAHLAQALERRSR